MPRTRSADIKVADELATEGAALMVSCFAGCSSPSALSLTEHYIPARVTQEGAHSVFAGLRELVKKMTFLYQLGIRGDNPS
jgi:hypothetical protein